MKRRFADARSNRAIIDSTIETKIINDKAFKGYMSLLKINKVKKECRVDTENRCILANNYKWLEMYPLDKHMCITAMFDEKNVIKEWYFDISKEVGIENGVPYEDDLYLDVVIVPDGRIHLLDEDELYKALEGKDITETVEKLEKLSEKFNIDFILSVSMDESELPENVKSKVVISL